MGNFRNFKGGEEFSGSRGDDFKGVANFQDPGGGAGLCRTMKFFKGVQTPDGTIKIKKKL